MNQSSALTKDEFSERLRRIVDFTEQQLQALYTALVQDGQKELDFVELFLVLCVSFIHF